MVRKYTINGIRKLNEDEVVENTFMLFHDIEDIEDVKIRYNEPACGELESYTLMTKGFSTQGITIKKMGGGSFVVELPWLASKADVNLCYAFLNAVKKVHRTCRITDEDEKVVKLTENDALEQWHLRLSNMEDILNKGEKIVITGVFRDYHLDPSHEQNKEDLPNRAGNAFKAFITLQWIDLDSVKVREEKRHITEEEELSTLRVIDNTQNVFIGVCQYVGMMKGNACKMVEFDDFCQLMEGREEFRRMDAAQFLLHEMEEAVWNQLYGKAKGIVRENFRKTFIMRWNTDISNYKLNEFEGAMEDFDDDGFYYDWSIWDYQKAHIGDKFYMIRTGEGKNGVVMSGIIIGTPYPDEDWSGRGRKVYYIRMSLSHMIHPDKSSFLLTTDELGKGVPGFCWDNGHSGEMLTDEQAAQLEEVWQNYVEQVHQRTMEDEMGNDFNKHYKERGWRMLDTPQRHDSSKDPQKECKQIISIVIPRLDQWLA